MWYTLDLPYNDGPWKLSGLPGLIMKADDTKGDYSFTAISITKGDGREISHDMSNRHEVSAKEMAERILLYSKDWVEYNNRYSDKKIYISGFEDFMQSETACLLEYP